MGKDSVERRNFAYYILRDIVKLQGFTHLCVMWGEKTCKSWCLGSWDNKDME